jgi:lipoprotein-releasing system permease protein
MVGIGPFPTPEGKEAREPMYKYLLCWRYLRTRYIALASVISVMLGVATMIVVNAVMAGFSEKMRDRLHGVLSDVVVEGTSFDGFANAHEVMSRVKEIGGDRIEAMAPTVEIPGILTFYYGSERITKLVQVIGVRPEERAKTGDFAEFLFNGDREPKPIPPSFEIGPKLLTKSKAEQIRKGMPATSQDAGIIEDLERFGPIEVPDFGAIPGYALATYHQPGVEHDLYLAPVGSKITLTFPSLGEELRTGREEFTVVGYFKSGMSEYDSSFVYVPLERLQLQAGMMAAPGVGKVNQIQIKTRPGTDLDVLSAELNGALWDKWPTRFRVQTWEEKQGPLLAAVAVEKSILNILLFFIIAVAGFGILAIFSMIVVEKTRDIGVLKSLGASTGGVRGIFLGYGLSLGLVGSGVGMLGGLLFVWNINAIEKWISGVLGHKVFDDTIYYFNEIPTLVEPFTVAWIVVGALSIAVAASIWPAQRAAKLHPVKALRYE